MKKVKLKQVLKNYKNKHMIQNDKTYRQVTISQTGEVSFRGEKHGLKIGRKRQFLIDLKNHPNTLIFIRQGVMKGGIGICPSEVDGCVVTENMPMFDIIDINPDYLRNFIKSPLFKEDVSKLVPVGTAQKALHENKLLEIEIPCPPEEKQEEIVQKIQSIEKEVKQLEGKSVYDKTLLQKLRQAILQEAVQGKLVPIDPKDESATVLLERIKKEKENLIEKKKIRKEKPLPPIEEKEVPYELPKGWGWCRLGDVILSDIGGGTPSKNKNEYWNGDIYWASVKDLNEKTYLTKTQDTITELGLKNSSSNLVPKENVIICTRMGLGKILINKIDVAINQDLRAIFLSDLMSQRYFYDFYRTLNFVHSGTTVSGIRREKLLAILFPLPPLSEQKRIVEKVDKLMKLCNELEDKINQNKIYAEKLVNAILREVFEDEK